MINLYNFRVVLYFFLLNSISLQIHSMDPFKFFNKNDYMQFKSSHKKNIPQDTICKELDSYFKCPDLNTIVLDYLKTTTEYEVIHKINAQDILNTKFLYEGYLPKIIINFDNINNLEITICYINFNTTERIFNYKTFENYSKKLIISKKFQEKNKNKCSIDENTEAQIINNPFRIYIRDKKTNKIKSIIKMNNTDFKNFLKEDLLVDDPADPILKEYSDIENFQFEQNVKLRNSLNEYEEHDETQINKAKEILYPNAIYFINNKILTLIRSTLIIYDIKKNKFEFINLYKLTNYNDFKKILDEVIDFAISNDSNFIAIVYDWDIYILKKRDIHLYDVK